MSNVYVSWPNNQPGLWATLKEIATEINGTNGLSAPLVSGYISFRSVTSSDNTDIETLLMEYNGYKYLLAGNKNDNSVGNVTFTISGLPLSSVTEYFDKGVISISNNQFTDSTSRGATGGFAGSQVHVYEID